MTLLVVCYLVSKIFKVKGYPFEVVLPKGFGVEGVILSDQIKNLDYVAREIAYICEVPHEVLVTMRT